MANIALIPARSGSKRLPSKNIRKLKGLPLIHYSIQSAISSGVFSEIIVSTDSEEIGLIARHCGAEVPLLRPAEISLDNSPDIEWVLHAMNHMIKTPSDEIESITILRPTSPLRTGKTISAALNYFHSVGLADSLRAMERTFKHPGKMWLVDEAMLAKPFVQQQKGIIPTHDSPTQALQKLWIQNASLEIMKRDTVLLKKSISGDVILGYEMPGYEGYDVNSLLDFEFLEYLVSKYPELLEEAEHF